MVSGGKEVDEKEERRKYGETLEAKRARERKKENEQSRITKRER